jgi:hypothetical protein
MAERANSPATRREQLFRLLQSRTQAEPLWRDDELAAELCCCERTVKRLREWLMDTGRLSRRRRESVPCSATELRNGTDD